MLKKNAKISLTKGLEIEPKNCGEIQNDLLTGRVVPRLLGAGRC